MTSETKIVITININIDYYEGGSDELIEEIFGFIDDVLYYKYNAVFKVKGKIKTPEFEEEDY